MDDAFGWDDGLICGGSAQIFIQPLVAAAPSSAEVFRAAIALKDERRRGMLAMVVEAPSPADIGRTLLVPEEGPIVGALEDAALAEEVAAAPRRLWEAGGESP